MNKIWIEKPSPKSLGIGTGWFANINHVYKFEDKYVCLTREIETKWGKVTHCAIRNASSTDIPWAEKQWIKDTLFGEDRVAIEVFPREDRLIDEANMYHLWVFEEGFELPFGIHSDDLSEKNIEVN